MNPLAGALLVCLVAAMAHNGASFKCDHCNAVGENRESLCTQTAESFYCSSPWNTYCFVYDDGMNFYRSCGNLEFYANAKETCASGRCRVGACDESSCIAEFDY